MFLSVFLNLFTFLIAFVVAAPKEQWRSRAIYQVMVDRFARTDSSTTAHCNVTDRIYCGGTWKGLQNNLDYIQGMGFDAIWISPISKGINSNTGDGSDYTGYWVTDMTQLNSNFGTQQDLLALSKEVHNRGMFLMLDIVVNNMAALGDPTKVNYGSLNPLNKQEYFHPYCPIDYTNRASTLDCWMGDNVVPLPDVNTENPDVQQMISQWIETTVNTYSIDGLRIDAAKSIPYFFAQMVNNVTDSYSIGEVFDGDAGYACAYQSNGLDAFLNFPIYYQMVGAFYSTTSTQMAAFPAQVAAIQAACPDTTVLGTFTEGHDVARMAYYTEDVSILSNVNTWNILFDGIPVVYQGQEQRFRGNVDPYNREAVWLSGYSTNSTIYVLLKFLNRIIPSAFQTKYEEFRQGVIKRDSDYVTTLSTAPYTDSQTVVFLKKEVMTVLSNAGSAGESYTITIPMHSAAVNTAGTEYTDIIACGKVKIASTGDFVTTIVNGMPQVWFPSSSLADIGFNCGLPPSSDAPTNTAGDAESPEGTHNPYGGTTYTPGPSPNAAGKGIAGLARRRTSQRMSTSVLDLQWIWDVWVLGWAFMGALFVLVL